MGDHAGVAPKLGFWLGSRVLRRLVLLVACACIAAIAFLYLSLAVPAADDFCRAVANPDGPLAQAAMLYRVWTGRWLTSLFFATVTPMLDLYGGGYPAALAVAILVWLLGFRLAAGMILGRESRPLQRWGLAILLFALFWAGAPGPGEIFYWLSGAFEYGGPFALAMLSLRLLAGVAAPRRALSFGLAAGLVGILVAGAHEFAGALLLGFSLCWTGALWAMRERRAALPCAVAIGLVVVGLAINQLAPGTSERAGLFPHAGDMERALALTFAPRSTPLAWLADFRLWALSLFLLALPADSISRPGWTHVPAPILALLPLATLAGVLCGWMLGAYGIGFAPPDRLQSLLYATFVAGWSATTIAFRQQVEAWWPGVRARPIAANLAAGLLGLALLLSWNSRAAVYDLRHVRAEWLRLNQQRLDRLADAARSGGGDVVLSGGWPKPALLKPPGLSEDPAEYRNRCAARIFGISSVRMAPGEGEFRRNWR